MLNVKAIEVMIGHYNAFFHITNVADTFSLYLMPSFHIIPMQFLIVFFIALYYYTITLGKNSFIIFLLVPHTTCRGCKELFCL